ncbi:DUF7511 domain-containing protein [Halorientalis salina]|uniref:DUF7511 domain-containing protein n=1 Tax=Halorientalis salina TaxID=2932266 RepID=UPI0010AC4885|nr:hypothetical protein [Halorientalis salina]
MSHSGAHDRRQEPDEHGAGDHRLESVLVPHADGPDELTLYPADASDERIVTTWMTAQEGAYVSLDDWR